MSRGAAMVLLGLGVLLFAAWIGGIALLTCRGVPKGEAILARTGISIFQAVGGGGCTLVFISVWIGNLLPCIRGETAPDLWVLLWSGLLTLVGMAVVWMTMVRRVWCTSAALVQRTWRGELLIAPWRELQGAEAVFSYDDVIIPWGEKQLTIDTTLSGFDEVADWLKKQGIDLSARPPGRPSFFHKRK